MTRKCNKELRNVNFVISFLLSSILNSFFLFQQLHFCKLAIVWDLRLKNKGNSATHATECNQITEKILWATHKDINSIPHISRFFFLFFSNCNHELIVFCVGKSRQRGRNDASKIKFVQLFFHSSAFTSRCLEGRNENFSCLF